MAMDRRIFLAWAATVLLLTLCLLPSHFFRHSGGEQAAARKIPHLDKVIHFTMFAGAAFLWANALRSTGRVRVVTVLAWGVVFAAGTELLQGLPQVQRDPDILDALADVVGTFAGVAVASVWASWTWGKLTAPEVSP